MVSDYSTLALTAYQQLYQVLTFEARNEYILGALRAARVVEEFNTQAKLANRRRAR